MRRRLHPRGHAAPPAYPAAFERACTLTDGRTVHVRPVVPDDAEELKAAVERADPETLHLRFLGGRPPQTDDEFRRLVTLDYDRRFAVAAFDENGTGIGIARYESKAGSDRAEVAVAVDAQWRRLGVATALFRVLGEAAVGNGITTLTLEFLADNSDVAALVAESLLPVESEVRDNVVHVAVDVSGAADTLG